MKKRSHTLRLLVLSLLVWALAPVAARAEPPMTLMHVHGLSYSADGAQLMIPSHNGLAVFANGRWSKAAGPAHDYMGYSATSDALYSSGHPAPGSGLTNPFGLIKSRDGGKTWQPITTDLPSLDIHGFARDPGDPARMWAALATGGLWASSDFGAHWTQVRQDNVLSPLAVRMGATTRLLGVDATGLVSSDDGGRSWSGLATPPTYPMTGLAATPDGQVVYAGSPEGLYRSADGGESWSATAYKGSAFAIATSADGAIVAVVSKETDFFRSPDGGATWPGPK